MDERPYRPKSGLRMSFAILAHATAAVSIASAGFLSLKSHEIYQSAKTSIRNDFKFDLTKFSDLTFSKQYRSEILPTEDFKKIRVKRANKKIVALGKQEFEFSEELIAPITEPNEKDVFAILTEKFDQSFIIKEEYPVEKTKDIHHDTFKNIKVKNDIVKYSAVKKSKLVARTKPKRTVDIRALMPKQREHKQSHNIQTLASKTTYENDLRVMSNFSYSNYLDANPTVLNNQAPEKKTQVITQDDDSSKKQVEMSTQNGNKITIIGYSEPPATTNTTNEAIKSDTKNNLDVGVKAPNKKDDEPIQNEPSNDASDTHTTTDICTIPLNLKGYSGRVVSAFKAASEPIVGAKIQILGTDRAEYSDSCGNFYFKEIKSDGMLPVEMTYRDYRRRIAIISKNKTDTHELISNNAVKMSALISNETQLDQNGYLFIELDSQNRENKTIEIVGLISPSIVYIDDSGKPNKSLSSTSSRGQFVAHNLSPGTYIVGISDMNGTEYASRLIQISKEEGVVEKIKLGVKKSISGQIVDLETNKEMAGLKVRLLGNSKEVITNKQGRFNISNVFVDCDVLTYLQISGEYHYTNRVKLNCDQTDELKIPVADKQTIEKYARQTKSLLSPGLGIVLGHSSYNKSVKAQLWGHDEQDHENSPRGFDFYLNGSGDVSVLKNRTAKNGNYLIMDSPEGLSYLQLFDRRGNIVSYSPIFISASTISINIQ